MRKCLVRIRHAVRIFLLLDRITAIIRRVQQFSSKPVCHRLFASPAGILNNPANRQSTPPLLMDFDRHLIGRTANASGLDFDRRPDVVNGLLKDLEWLFSRLVSNLS
jgi:hypothetical protein